MVISGSTLLVSSMRLGSDGGVKFGFSVVGVSPPDDILREYLLPYTSMSSMVIFVSAGISLILARSAPLLALSSYLVSLRIFPLAMARNFEMERSPDQVASTIFCHTHTIFTEIFTEPTPPFLRLQFGS